jgi:hypothetical protein
MTTNRFLAKYSSKRSYFKFKDALNKFLGNTSSPSGAEARVFFGGFMYGLKPVPFT